MNASRQTVDSSFDAEQQVIIRLTHSPVPSPKDAALRRPAGKVTLTHSPVPSPKGEGW
jgi:hypothetical protein